MLAEKACPNFKQLFAVAPGRHNKVRNHVRCRDTRTATALAVELAIGRCICVTAKCLEFASKVRPKKLRLSLEPVAYRPIIGLEIQSPQQLKDPCPLELCISHTKTMGPHSVNTGSE
jgi:predicted NAD/FAD-dependent oxidoreductase